MVATHIWYYRPVRRLAFFLALLLTVSACGRKVQVSVPRARPGAPSSASSASATVSIPKSELEGLASYYAEPYNGRKTASGEIFDTYKEMTAAHRTLPFNTVVRVTNKTNGESVDVRINDRGPFVDGRVIDLSLYAAQKIDMVRAGVVPVKLNVLKDGDAAEGDPSLLRLYLRRLPSRLPSFRVPRLCRPGRSVRDFADRRGVEKAPRQEVRWSIDSNLFRQCNGLSGSNRQ